MKKICLLYIGIGFVLTAVLFYIYSRHIEPNCLVVNRYEIVSNKWRGDDRVIRIMQLSDLHLPTMSATLREKVIKAVHAEAPDLILITGDVLSFNYIMNPGNEVLYTAELDTLIPYLSRLQAPLGIYMVRGNHDLSDEKEVSDQLLLALRRAGFQVLANQMVKLRVGKNELYLTGIDYSAQDSLSVQPFMVQEQDGRTFLASGASRRDSYTHFYPHRQDDRWRDYTVTARVWAPNTRKSAIGITFYSQFHNGLDYYYQIRISSGKDTLQFVAHNTTINQAQPSVALGLTPDSWYWCKVMVSTKEKRTSMAARVWREDEAEPDVWHAAAFDSGSQRLTDGTVGFWSIYEGPHRFGDIRVITANDDTLLYETWQQAGLPHKPQSWIDFHYNETALPFLTASIPDSAFNILLCHSPETLPQAVAAGIDLMLSGHTHGGQIRLPLQSIHHLQLDTRYGSLSGLSRHGNTTLHVSQGLGLVYLPLRFLTPPEITVFELAGPRD